MDDLTTLIMLMALVAIVVVVDLVMVVVRRAQRGRFRVLLYHSATVTSFTLTEKEKWLMQINNEHPGLVGIVALLTTAGNPAPWDNPPAWTLSDPEVVDMTVIETGTASEAKAEFRPRPLPDGVDAHTTQVELRGDADLGEGVREVVAVGSITVTRVEGAIAEMRFEEIQPPTPV